MPWAVANGWGRRSRLSRCGGGSNLASDAEFATQRVLAEEMLDWYAMYPTLLRRLESGVTPFCIQDFCGGGGSSEGCRRAGGASHGVDAYEQEDYCRRFGEETFTLADGMSWSTVKKLRDRHRAAFIMGGPPCKFYSRARVRGAATQPPLIDGFRDLCTALFGEGKQWAIENVMGAQSYMSPEAVVVDGSLFGLKVARARLYETSFPLRVDECVRAPAEKLASRCCLGGRRRFRRFDEFGRPERDACCQGNIFAVVGKTPWRCTADECADAMGMDRGHMSYERLAQSVPPQYSQLVFSQMCMYQAHQKYGVPVITFDDLQAAPSEARRTMAFWLRGAGAAEATLGQLFQPAPSLAQESGVSCRAEHNKPAEGCAREAEFRELYYSHAGGYDQQWVLDECSARLSRVCRGTNLARPPSQLELAGKNTYVEVSVGATVELAKAAAEAVRKQGTGTRATFVVSTSLRVDLERLGYQYLPCCVGGKGPDALSYKGLVAMHLGSRAGVTQECHLDHEAARAYMDWRDQGGYEFDPVEKARITWQDFPHDPERYRGKGMKAWVEDMMVNGAKVSAESEVIAKDHQQYMWPDGIGLMEAILETERHLAIGSLEYVPDDEVADVLANQVVHPILLVAQGKGKFRACHDYSRGTNKTARSSPFGLPKVWDARDAVKPGSYFVKYDLRDGFFAVPVELGSRNRLVVRHPATGRLLRCARLPFGYVDSPRLFCGLTEEIAAEVRRRTVGKGVSVFVFVDDFLVVGDSKEAARFGGEVLEEVLYEFGIPWAPHKQRGPARCMEFLGLLLVNTPEQRCVALTEKRQQKLVEQIQSWRARQPSPVGMGAAGSAEVVVDAHELASFLGHLVFCSQVVPQGRTYMQAMLSQFAGLEVDWRRGEVRATGGKGAWAKGVVLRAGFWRDLEWWHERFQRRNSTPMEKAPRGEVAVCGTDASDWGTGQLMWEDGRRAETVLRFSLTERARSINWRELLGIVRVLEQFGPELEGRALLIEGDNTASLAAAENETSKAEDSQELVRRLVELAERYHLSVRFTHTPGVKLDRPDQTSRGDPIEEPRARVEPVAYSLLEKRFGPFTEWMGAERRFASTRASDGQARVWMHPAHATVGSALRRLGERLSDHNGQASGLVIVPHDERARWWPLTRHFRVVGRWPEGSGHLEANRVGKWERTSATRASLILAFPRSAGPGSAAVVWQDGDRTSYSESCVQSGTWLLPMVAGTFVYARSDDPDSRGVLYQVWKNFDPRTERGVKFDENMPTVQVAELLACAGQAGSSGSQIKFMLDGRGPGDGSFSGHRQRAWAVDATLLYDVSHLVTVLQRAEEGLAKDGGMLWSKAKSIVVTFDWRECEASLQQQTRRVTVNEEEEVAELAAALGDAELGESAEETLAAARRSAVEAAAARKRVGLSQAAKPPPATKPAARRVETTETHYCRYSEMRCEGCTGLIGWGKPMWAGGRGMVHPLPRCLAEAERKMANAEAEAKVKMTTSAEAGTGSLKRGAQADHRVSEERIQVAMHCLDGKCMTERENQNGPPGESRTMCIRGCGRGIHAVSCCMFSKGVAQLGNLTCAYCRAADLMQESCTPGERLVVRMVESMLIEAATGAAATHRGYSDLAMLERKWVLDVCEGDEVMARNVKLPHTSETGCYAFVCWLANKGGRARSMGTTLKQMQSFCSKLGIENPAASKRVKKLLDELAGKGLAVNEPDTQVTTMMIEEMYGRGGTIELECCKNPKNKMGPLMTARETVNQDLELVGGMRVAEVCGGGDGHGLLANNVCIQRSAEAPEFGETIEAKLEDSKTGYGRWTVFAGVTEKSKIETAKHMRWWWKQSGVTVHTKHVGAFVEERPDYWVVRVSLLDMSREVYLEFMNEVEYTTDLVMLKDRKHTLKYAKERRGGETLGEEMKYVNVTGGTHDGSNVKAAMAWLSMKGFLSYASVVPGPLMRATNGHALTHMPYSPKSTHTHLIPAMQKAFERVKATGRVDPEYDSTTDPVPKFGNHSNRRHADRVAMRNASATAVSDQDIDFFFGWNLKKMKESMRLHYAGMDRLLRLQLSKVTKMM